MSNPWDVPELSEPDADDDKLYSSIGRALSAWEGVEHHLASFFEFFVSGPGDDAILARQAARRAYGSVVAFQGRSTMLAAAAEIYFAEEARPGIEKRFNELLDRAIKLAARRNEIAHGRVRPTWFGIDVACALTMPPRWVLLPSEYATNKHRLVLDTTTKKPIGLFPKYVYSSREIDGLAKHFRQLESEAFDLMIDWSNAYPDEAPAPRI